MVPKIPKARLEEHGIKEFLEELSIDVEAVDRENNIYRRYKRRQYIEAAERAVQGEDHSQGEGG